MTDPRDLSRRRHLAFLATGSSALLLPQIVTAMSKLPPGKSVFEVKGTVLVNGKQATKDTVIFEKDTVETKGDGQMVFAVGSNAFLIRNNSKVELDGSASIVRALRLVAGKLLSVYGDGRKRVTTPTATIGIRGTGTYMESEPDRTYLCTCYGTVEMAAASAPDVTETVSTKYHESPRYIIQDGNGGARIETAPVINHTDLELRLLESLVGRSPPFDGESEGGGGSY